MVKLANKDFCYCSLFFRDRQFIPKLLISHHLYEYCSFCEWGRWVWNHSNILIGRVNNIPTMQFFTGISRNTQSKSYMLSLTECVWDFQRKLYCGIGIIMPYYLNYELPLVKIKVIAGYKNTNVTASCYRLLHKIQPLFRFCEPTNHFST